LTKSRQNEHADVPGRFVAAGCMSCYLISPLTCCLAHIQQPQPGSASAKSGPASGPPKKLGVKSGGGDLAAMMAARKKAADENDDDGYYF
jgi:hypothetical protein